MGNQLKATHEELCDRALEHYEELTKLTGEWHSVVANAIKFYKKYARQGIIKD